jgi:hypothetical protein
MGRYVLDALHVRIYEMNGETEWINTMKRQASKQEWLKEIIDTKKEKPHLYPCQMDKQSASIVADDEWDDSTKGKKRSTTGNDASDNAVNRKKKVRTSISIDTSTIMDIIHTPTQR